MRNTILRFILICVFCLIYTQTKSQYIPAISSSLFRDVSSSYSTYNLSFNLKSLKIISFAPSLEIMYSTNTPFYYYNSSDQVNSNIVCFVLLFRLNRFEEHNKFMPHINNLLLQDQIMSLHLLPHLTYLKCKHLDPS